MSVLGDVESEIERLANGLTGVVLWANRITLIGAFCRTGWGCVDHILRDPLSRALQQTRIHPRNWESCPAMHNRSERLIMRQEQGGH